MRKKNKTRRITEEQIEDIMYFLNTGQYANIRKILNKLPRLVVKKKDEETKTTE